MGGACITSYIETFALFLDTNIHISHKKGGLKRSVLTLPGPLLVLTSPALHSAEVLCNNEDVQRRGWLLSDGENSYLNL